MSIVYVYVGFWTDHSRIETRVDENGLVRVETNNFMGVVRLCLLSLPSAGRELSTSQSAGDALRLGSKGRYGSFRLWINVWVAGKTV